MDPVNKKEIYASYKNFVLQFCLLLAFSLCGVFLFLKAADREYEILKEKNEEIEHLMSSRIQINHSISLINKRFKELGENNSGHADQIAKRRVLQTEISNITARINKLIAGMKDSGNRSSVQLYKKLNTDVLSISRLQDSLFTTKNFIESRRLQLQSCLDLNRQATSQLNRGSLRR